MNAMLRLRSLIVSAAVCAASISATSVFAADVAPAATAEGAAAPVAAPLMLANFTEDVPGLFHYGSWQGKLAVAPKQGLRIQGTKGAQGSGGFGHDIAPAIDLNKFEFIEVALAVQPGNEVPQYAVGFNDADGTLFTARIRVDQIMPGQPVWFRLKRSDFAAQGGTQAGKDGKIDWTKVAKWHLQGDYTTAKPAQVLFIGLRAR